MLKEKEEPNSNDCRHSKQLPGRQREQPSGGDRGSDGKSVGPATQDSCCEKFGGTNGKCEWPVNFARGRCREHEGGGPNGVECIGDVTEPDDGIAAYPEQRARQERRASIVRPSRRRAIGRSFQTGNA